MEKNDPKKIIKILVIIGIILSAISLLIPWAVFSYSITIISERASIGTDFYPWGLHAKIGITSIFDKTSVLSQEMWSFFYSKDMVVSDPYMQNFLSNIYLFSEDAEASAVTAFLISFILCLCTIIFGLFAIPRKNICLLVGITSLISIIAFISSITILLANDPIGLLSQRTDYSLGLYLMFCAMIIFFISYVIHLFIPTMALDQITQQTYPSSQPPPQIFQQNKTLYSPKPSSSGSRKTCPKCGISISDYPEYCSNCGAKLR